MSKFVENLKEDIKGMEAHHQQKKEERHEKHEEHKFARELKHQMKHEEHLKNKKVVLLLDRTTFLFIYKI